MHDIITLFNDLPTIYKLLWLIACLSLCWLLETLIPKRQYGYDKKGHVHLNLQFLAINLLLNVVIALLFLYVADAQQQQQWGLFHWWPIDLSVQFIITLLWFDFTGQYLAHVALHKQRFLWRLHKVHHSDETVDTTTGTRLHPLDYIFRETLTLAAFALIGAPMAFYMMYRLLTIFFTYFSHANIRLPAPMEKIMKTIFITPHTHKFHHHKSLPWTDCNYGGIFSIWDKIFGTWHYDDKDNIDFGIDKMPPQTHDNFVKLLLLKYPR